MENKKINFPKPYYEEHNLLQTSTEIENEKQQKIDDYLKLASAHFEEGVRSAENFDQENYANVISSANEKIGNDLNVNNTSGFEDWFIDNEFVDQDLEDASEEGKTFIHDIMERTSFLPNNINYKN